MIRIGQSLEKIVEGTTHLKQVRKADLQYGDLLLITTLNSVYSVRVLDNDLYLVSGGWFDRKGLSPITFFLRKLFVYVILNSFQDPFPCYLLTARCSFLL